METTIIELNRERASELWREYREHRHYATEVDREIQRAYRLIAQGRVIIRAIESIKQAGLNEDGLPKLAIVRADASECFWRPERGGGSFRIDKGWPARRNTAKSRRIDIPEGTWEEGAPRSPQRWEYTARAPLIPIKLRPRHALDQYYVLWEAEWSLVVPKDPMLLRRIGEGDLWLVVASWDLTPVEMAALSTRVSVA